jgi:hypothetical protein
MADPVTLAVLGSWAAAEGIKFLYGQAAEVLKAWREQRRSADADKQPSSQVPVPILTTEAFDTTPERCLADLKLLDTEHRALTQLLGALAPYAQGQADIDLDDTELAEQAGKLRALLEAIYRERFTFIGELRDPTGTGVTIKQVLGTVAGTVVGVAGDAGPGADIAVEQNVDSVATDGTITGFKGRINP